MYILPSPTQTVPSTEPIFVVRNAVISMGILLLTGTGCNYSMDHAHGWSSYVQTRVPFIIDSSDASFKDVEQIDVRTVAEHIENIRGVFDPSISDLALLFDVSRQTIYKWMSGTSTPEQDKSARIAEFSRTADEFRKSEVLRARSLLKIKTFDGRSLMDLFRSGESSDEHVKTLIIEAKAMENSYKKSGLSSSKSKSTSDWQSYISIPGSIE